MDIHKLIYITQWTDVTIKMACSANKIIIRQGRRIVVFDISSLDTYTSSYLTFKIIDFTISKFTVKFDLQTKLGDLDLVIRTRKSKNR